YIELVDKVCPCVVMVHSQSGTFGYRVLEARPDQVKALVAVEPMLGGDRNKVQSIKASRSWSFTAIMQKIILDGRRSARAASITPLFSNPRRQHRRGRSAGGRHQGQFTHDDDGQEQQSGRRPHPEMVARQRIGAMSTSAAAAQH